ncbi:heme-binding protein [Novosphingobium resinovorum]|uniref:heme-binding protein n=1 Tax=Novosphingobium resinovorum TaxID=158500 RepID=UPI002ED014EF|nr:heme-binding protein [Novosphingobium resinovorum]
MRGKTMLGLMLPLSLLPAGQALADDGVPSLATTIAQMPKNLPRAEGPPLDAAIAAARKAVAACAARGSKVSVLVADVVGKPVVLLSGEGAGVRSQLIAQTKANIVARFHEASGLVASRAQSDPALVAQAAADPGIGLLRGGGLPVRRGAAMIGIVAVSGGGLTGDLTLDETCARVAVADLEAPGK